VQSGVVGKIREVHTWSNKKWGDSEPAPSRKDPVPSGLAWDLWLGVAAGRDYIDGLYHPGNWRKRLDFGTGTLGDMGCHIFDPVFKALGVGAPLSVRSEGAPPNDWSWSTDAVIHYTFPASRFTEGQTVKVTWYDGDQRPPPHIQSLLDDAPLPQQGSIFIGTKGQILVPHIDFPKLFPLEDFRDHPYQKLEGLSHHGQFIDAILGKAAPTAGFDYSGALTEAVLLGSLATFYPQTTLEWDSPALRFKNHEEANQRIRRTYRTGWEVPSLA
jgi:predicted dehydrogenase